MKHLYLRSMGSPVNVVAPMVDASELAWRMLGRRAFTPRIQKVRLSKCFCSGTEHT